MSNPAALLTDEELSAYQREGQVVPRGYRLPAAALARLRGAADRIIEQTATRDPDLVLVAHLPHRPGINGLDGGEEIFKVLIEPSLLDLVEQLIGPDIILWGSSVFAKPPGIGKAVQWHQEGHYWPMRPLIATSAWIAIDDASPENGCLRFVPGSHCHGLYRHNDEHRANGLLQRSINDSAFDDASAGDIVVSAGQVSLLDTFVAHGSHANESSRRRAALTVRYMAATSYFDRGNEGVRVREGGDTADYRTRPIWLVRGENRHPGNDYSISHEGLEDYDELAEAARITHLQR
ncbi:MAG: phytanoyl-CoA dioxygenase family protein [Acidimicrobiales bacterium]